MGELDEKGGGGEIVNGKGMKSHKFTLKMLPRKNRKKVIYSG